MKAKNFYILYTPREAGDGDLQGPFHSLWEARMNINKEKLPTMGIKIIDDRLETVEEITEVEPA